MSEKQLDVRNSDGRISPAKAFGVVREAIATLSDEDFVRLATTPAKVRTTAHEPNTQHGGSQ